MSGILGEVAMEIFPVVHIKDNGVHAATHECNQAFELGADGVYLIDHYNGVKDTEPLFKAYNNVLTESPDKYVGINIFGSGPYDSMRALAEYLNKSKDLPLLPPSGLWVDDMRYDGLRKTAAIELRDSDPRLQHVRFLGGVACNHTNTYTENPTRAAYETEWLKDSVDVVVTSGVSMGRNPVVEKLMAMKEAVDDKPLAVTSDMSTENICRYEWIVNEILVSRSTETLHGSDTLFNRHKLEELIKLAHSIAD